MVSKSSKRKARTERGSGPSSDIKSPRTKMDTVQTTRMGGSYVRKMGGDLDQPRRDLSRPVSANENPRRDWQARMGQVTDAIRAASRQSIDRLNGAHSKATATTPMPRQNSNLASQAGTLRAPEQKRPQRLEPAKKPERSDQTLRDGPVCKERPEKNRGMGTGRSFVPWCGRRG